MFLLAENILFLKNDEFGCNSEKNLYCLTQIKNINTLHRHSSDGCSSEGNTDGIGDCGVLRGGDDGGVADGMVVLAIGPLETMMVGL